MRKNSFSPSENLNNFCSYLVAHQESDAEATDRDNLIPSIGPPRIIQYQPEMERPYRGQELLPLEEEGDGLTPIQGVSDVSLPLSEIQEEGAVCEFCHGEIKQFPTPEMRDNFTSEEVGIVSKLVLFKKIEVHEQYAITSLIKCI